MNNSSLYSRLNWLLLTVVIAVGSLLPFIPAQAHDTPIALLSITERQQGVYQLDWTYSSPLNLAPPTPVFPEHCLQDDNSLNCGEQGLYGVLSMPELGEKYSAAVLQISRLKSKPESYTLTGANRSVTLVTGGVLPLSDVASAYIPLGFEHIMLGVDHLLFVLGLLWLVNNRWMLIKTITSFTVAHSLTLAAVTFGWLGVAEKPVNAAIALSIVILAVEIIRLKRGQNCLSARYPWAIAFGFGLLHGFGFAGALTKIGLPAENLPAALLFFNVGVELGQVLFVLLVLALLWAHRTLQSQFPRWSENTAIYAIGSIAAFWFVGRTFILLSTP